MGCNCNPITGRVCVECEVRALQRQLQQAIKRANRQNGLAWKMAYEANHQRQRAERAEKDVETLQGDVARAESELAGVGEEYKAAEALVAKGQQLREELEEVGNHAAGIVWDAALLAEWDALKAPAEALAQRGESDETSTGPPL